MTSAVFLYKSLLFLPIYGFVFCFFQLLLRTQLSRVQKQLMWFSVLAVLFVFDDAYYLMGISDFNLLLVNNIVSNITTPFLPILGIFVCLSLRRIDYHKLHLEWLLFVPLLYASAILSFLLLMDWYDIVRYEEAVYHLRHVTIGLGRVADLPMGFQHRVFLWYSRVFGTVYYALLLTELLVCVALCVGALFKHRKNKAEVFHFYFRQGKSSPFYITTYWMLILALWVLFRLLVGLPYMAAHTSMAMSYIFGLSFLSLPLTYTAQYDYLPVISFHGIMYPLIHGTVAENRMKDAPVVTLQANATIQDSLTSYQEIVDGMMNLMQNDRLYLNVNLTIEDVAAELNTNRVYVSRAVNNILNTSFRDYVNSLRINYAKDFMLSNPKATQEMIASNCGFIDGTAFNKKFRQITGMTPREWLLRGATKLETL